MSGAEIAGFLLAGPPLVVSWLEHYREVFEMLGCWKRFRNEYRKAETQLHALELSFTFTLEKLFLPNAESSEKLKQLKLDRNDKFWSETEENLRQRLLPETFSVYTSLLKDLKDAMNELEEELAYDNQKFQLELSAKSPSTSNQQKPSLITRVHQRKIYEFERVRFSTRKGPREEAVSNVEKILDRIQKLLVQNDETATYRANLVSKSKAAVRSNLLHFWRHAHAVYDLITQTWSCRCRQQHEADLLLFHRTSPDVTLDFWFHYAVPIPASCPWTILPTRIFKVELPMKPKPASRVRFALRRDRNDIQAADLLPINNLCHSLTKVKPGQSAVGLLSGQESSYSLQKLDLTINPNTITLASLLRLDVWEKPQRKQRYRIAATIASSHLQLHSSGWLKNGWNKDDIHFLYTSNEPNLNRIYLRKSFSDARAKESDPPFDIPFATLGILLLELCFGFTLEESRFRENHTRPDGGSDLVQDRAAAWDWAEKVTGEAGERWAHAIDWCIGKWKVRESDSAWRQDFCTAVVEPLQEEAAPV